MKTISKFFVIAILSVSFLACSDMSNNPVNSTDESQSFEKRNPASGITIYDVASSTSDFSILAAAVDAAGFDGLLDGNRQLTVFAPTNAAFETLLSDLNLTAPQLLSNTELLQIVLSYHVSPGIKKSQNVLSSGRTNTLQGNFIFSKIEEGMPKVGNDTYGYATISAPDNQASNGVIHIIESVLLPQDLVLE